LASEHNSHSAVDLLLEVTRKYFTTSLTHPCVIHDAINGHRNLHLALYQNTVLWTRYFYA